MIIISKSFKYLTSDLNYGEVRKHMRKSLAFGIVFLLICSVFIPMSLGLDVKTTPSESKVMDNLDYYFYNEHGSSKADYYREYLKQDFSNDDVVIDEQPVSVEPLEQILSSGPMDSAWPMYCQNVRHTGQSPYSTINNPGIEKWRPALFWRIQKYIYLERSIYRYFFYEGLNDDYKGTKIKAGCFFSGFAAFIGCHYWHIHYSKIKNRR